MEAASPTINILLERLALDDLPAGRKAAVLQRFGGEEKSVERMALLKASDEEILTTYPPETLAVQIHDRHERAIRRRVNRRLVWIAIPATVAAAAVAVLLLLPGMFRSRAGDLPWPRSTVHPPKKTTLFKGTPLLTVYRLGPKGVEILREGTPVTAGDLLQISYTAHTARQGVIFSLDGRGGVTLHFPRTAKHSTKLKRGGTQLLPYSYELDDEPKFERFFLVTSDKPIDVDSLLDACRKLKAHPKRKLKLPAGAKLQKVLTLRKPTKAR